MKRSNWRHLVIATVVLSFVSFACSDSTEPVESTTTTQEDLREVYVSATDYAFDPDVIQVEAGETVRFIVTNDGARTHEFEIITMHEIESHDHESGHDDSSADAVRNKIEVSPGRTRSLIYTFKKAEELFYVCLITNHYERGQSGRFDFGDDMMDQDHDDDGHEDNQEHGEESGH